MDTIRIASPGDTRSSVLTHLSRQNKLRIHSCARRASTLILLREGLALVHPVGPNSARGTGR